MPKTGELIDEYCHRVSDLGFPISKDGLEILENLEKERVKRDQDMKGLYIYNDWNGWSITEIMENLVGFSTTTTAAILETMKLI